MTQRLLGIETEYAFTATGGDGRPLDREETLGQFMTLARRRLRHLPDMHSSGLFIVNGSRFYIDCGQHPELSTPECTSPLELVRYILAGESILSDIAADMIRANRKVAEVNVLSCNVDYSGSNSTWGCHESYLHRVDPRIIPEQIIPHLVSRVVLTGAGGFSMTRTGMGFTLSPRAAHMTKTISDASTSARGIFHTKDEPLCSKGYHRLHILCGESLRSQVAMLLKTGSTALIVAMIEGGLRPGDAVQLASPLQAMRCFAEDATCTVTVRAASGKSLDAIAIQRHYLTLAEAHLHEPFMPSWAGEVVSVWRRMLDQLERGAPRSVATVLDWAIKLALYRSRVEQEGRRWQSLIPADLTQVLCEVDSRFGQLGERGIFAAMDRAGVLDHRITGVNDFEDAISNPPAVGRAALRGRCIKRLAGTTGRYVADWQGIWDLKDGRFLDLSDPFATEEKWRSSTEGENAPPDLRSRLHRRLGLSTC